MKTSIDVTVSIVTYNTKNEALKCIESIYKYTKNITFEIIVVDNNSSDGTVISVQNKYPNVKVIKNKKNKFYTKANNQALKEAKGDYFLILNSDTYFKNNAIQKMVHFLNTRKEYGACEGLELYENGTLVPNGSKNVTPIIDFYELSILGKRFKNKKKLRAFRYASKKRNETFDIEVGCDAFLMVRTEVMRKIKGYNENLNLYYTENDLCIRIRKEGYKIVHLGNSYLFHKVSYSANKLKWKKLELYYKDLKYYYKVHGYAILGLFLYFLLRLELILLRVFRPRMFT